MLDEWTEYEQYTELSKDMAVFRLNYRNLTNSLAGLDRAMTVVARRFLFEDDFFENGENTPREIRTNAVKEVLKAWCGFGCEDTHCKNRAEAAEEALKALSSAGREELERIRNWFPSYAMRLLQRKVNEVGKSECPEFCKQICSSIDGIAGKEKRPNLAEAVKEASGLCEKYVSKTDEKAAKKKSTEMSEKEKKTRTLIEGFMKKICITVLDGLKKKERKFAAPLFPQELSADAAENDARSTTYESVIANAFEYGALRCRVLLVNAPKEISLYKYSQKKGYTQVKKEENGEDTILKLTAAYLIQRRFRLQAGENTEHKFEVVTKADVINWCKGDPKLDNIDTYYFGTQSDKKLIFETCLIGGNVFKIKVHEEFIQRFGLREIVGKDGSAKGQDDDQGAEIEALKKKLAGTGACEILWDNGSGANLKREKLRKTK